MGFKQRFLAKTRFIPNAAYMFLMTLVIFAIFSPKFLSLINISNIMLQSSMIIIVALGMTAVMLSNGIDLSVGSVMSLAGVVTGLLLGSGSGFVFSILGGVAAGILCGAFNGIMIAKVGLAPFIATFGMMGIADGISLFASGGESLYWDNKFFQAIANGHFLSVPVPVWIIIFIFLIMYLILYKTPFGINIFALGGNEEGLRLSGVNIVRNKIGIYILSGILASFAGIMLASRIASAHPTGGFGYEFEAISAAVIGGTTFFGGRGGIVGSVFGALMITIIRNGLSLLGYTTPWQYCLIGFILTVCVTINTFYSR
ncbi:MAG: ABC transporter permease [Desulfobacterales bacterium]